HHRCSDLFEDGGVEDQPDHKNHQPAVDHPQQPAAPATAVVGADEGEERVGHHPDEHGVIEGDEDVDRTLPGGGVHLTRDDEPYHVDEQADADQQKHRRDPGEVGAAPTRPCRRFELWPHVDDEHHDRHHFEHGGDLDEHVDVED